MASTGVISGVEAAAKLPRSFDIVALLKYIDGQESKQMRTEWHWIVVHQVLLSNYPPSRK